MSATGSVPAPKVQDQKLRNTLVRARRGAGLTQREVAAKLGWSISKVTRIERGETRVSDRDLRAALGLYGLPYAAKAWAEIRREARAESFWDRFKQVYSASYRRYLEFETSADSMGLFHMSTIPGVLQTRESFMATTSCGNDAEVELAWVVNAIRQRWMRNGTGPRTAVIMDEAALRRLPGSPTVMHNQISYLIELSQLTNVYLQVIPFSSGPHQARGPFSVLHFGNDPDLTQMAFSEPLIGEIQEVDPAASYALFTRLSEDSLEHEETRELLTQMKRELANSLQTTGGRGPRPVTLIQGGN